VATSVLRISVSYSLKEGQFISGCLHYEGEEVVMNGGGTEE